MNNLYISRIRNRIVLFLEWDNKLGIYLFVLNKLNKQKMYNFHTTRVTIKIKFKKNIHNALTIH